MSERNRLRRGLTSDNKSLPRGAALAVIWTLAPLALAQQPAAPDEAPPTESGASSSTPTLPPEVSSSSPDAVSNDDGVPQANGALPADADVPEGAATQPAGPDGAVAGAPNEPTSQASDTEEPSEADLTWPEEFSENQQFESSHIFVSCVLDAGRLHHWALNRRTNAHLESPSKPRDL